jgi:hypothetical protein
VRVGALLGDRFEIEQAVQAGGMGEVFRARDRVSDEPVAVKVLPDEREQRTARFEREIELLSSLSHPGIVRYVSHGVTSTGELYLVMEWLDGEDLKHRLERASLAMGEAVTLAVHVAQALAAAHARGIVHRDLNPSNLFLPAGRVDQVKVLDFGIALREGRSQLTETGTVIGTAGYMAPEQVRNTGVVDARADVFAVGCVLFQCLTGTPAFGGDSAGAILGKIVFGEVPQVSALWPEVPEDLDALVARMLAKDPALRPSDGAELAAALGALGPRAYSAAAAPRVDVVKPSSITGSERRFLAVVLLGIAVDDGQAEEALRRASKPFAGRVEQLTDGSIIVVLEADRQVATDQAAQAARCALALRGLAGGRPLPGAVGRAESTRQLPEGELIDRASQLLALTPRASGGLPPIALDDVSAGLLDARFDVIEDEAGLWLCGERAVMQGARTLLGRPTSCVGRDWELGALTGILDECIDESEPRVVLVVAAAGIGKTRLGTEFVARIQQRPGDLAIWIGRGDSLRAGSTLGLLAQALREALGIREGEPLAERTNRIRLRVAERVAGHDQQRVAEFLGELVGAPFPGGRDGSAALAAARQDSQLMSEQMRKAWIDFLDAETAVHPVLILFEDLQWGDFGTIRFIDNALRDRNDRPWMVLALARPEVFEVFPRLWAGRQSVQEIRLKELGRKAGERLVRQVLGDTVGAETVERLVRRADGNAFYLEELIRAAAEGNTALPETVLAMVETRLVRLAVEARRVLRAASVFGEVCWEGGVVVLLGGAMSTTMIGDWLAKLVEQEMLAVRPNSRFPGEREFAFRHALLREGAYATLTEHDRRLGHRLAGEWLEHHGEADPMVLAGHFERGRDGMKAGVYYLHAAEQASLAGDVSVAEARAHLGLACGGTTEVRASLLGLLCEVSYYDPRKVGAALPLAEEVMRLAPRGSVPWARGAASKIMGALFGGKIDDLVNTLQTFRDIVPAPDAVNALVLAATTGVTVLDMLGRIAASNEVIDLMERFCEVVGPVRDQRSIAAALWRVNRAIRDPYTKEDPWSSLEHALAALRICEEIHHTVLHNLARASHGMSLWYLGAMAEAEQVLGQAAPKDDELGVSATMWQISLAWLRADRGALDEARHAAQRLIDFGQSRHLATEESRGRWALAEVLRRERDLEGAEREIQAALTTISMVTPLDVPAALSTLCRVRLAQGRVAEALSTALEASGKYSAMDASGFFRAAFVRLTHAEALHASGALDAARHAIADVRKRLLAIADRISDPAYKHSFLHNVPENARSLALARSWMGETASGT